ncbi:hypothetical protein Pmar_PMAR015885 [Perkinsus marinus ATCC 50983]|uniref:Uncharacterized protein n=1 Tax=Perkinsus marinus (strain ATCC 50983 / TXsc) TaxID=423536 RepID=C5L664_PERM5|nr:hypothetical protein Pmar_PMAR015885 [Perkinsus marinus ATCC 50983]EER07779.1 hypothetical protein Pmar_PMAR015885 [Perkinsus marinus ATCC 50983]|eukprot:XP_002775963.1 hypothetical protein Pmar_PMAR015885 [Perkinsus marinus ATCC 50983]
MSSRLKAGSTSMLKSSMGIDRVAKELNLRSLLVIAIMLIVSRKAMMCHSVSTESMDNDDDDGSTVAVMLDRDSFVNEQAQAGQRTETLFVTHE